MPCPLQDATGDQAAGDVMPRCPLRARLTATQAALIRADTDHCLTLCADARDPTDLGSWSHEPMGGEGLGAVSDDEDVQATSQPAACGPIRVTPIPPTCLPVKTAMLLEPTAKDHPESRMRFNSALAGDPASKSPDAG